MYYPNKIERQVEELAKLDNKNTIMMSELDGVTEKGEKLYETNFQGHMAAYAPRERSYLYPIVYNQTHGCTLLIPKKCFETEGLFDPKERVAQDFEYFYRIFKVYPHHLIPEVLVTARDTSNRMGRRAKPRASIEYSRLYIKILKNLSEEEISLLAKDKLTLLSDMREFARYAGYIPMLEFMTNEIIAYTKPFCEEHISKYLSGQESDQALLDALYRLAHEHNQIHTDSAISANAIDDAVSDVLRTSLKAHIKKQTSGQLRKLINLYDVLLKGGYTYSAACLLQLVIASLIEQKQSDKVRELVHTKLIGSDVALSQSVLQKVLIKNATAKKPRIMFCSTHWLTGGMERVMSLIFERLKADYDIFLLTPYDGREAHIALPEGVTHVKISGAMFYSNYDNAALGLALCLDIKILVGFYNLFEKQLDLYRLCRKAGVKTISSNHENFFYPYTHYSLQDMALKRQEVYHHVDAVLWPTNFSAAVCGLDCASSYLMPNPNTFSVDDTAEEKKDKVIICVGRFNDYVKRIDRILESFKLVQDKLPESKLMLVGDCDRKKKNELLDDKSINDMIAERNLDEKNIIFTGKVSNVQDYYKRASALMLTSTSEGFGMVINEAACFGVPAVCNKIPGIEDLITHGENGFLTDQDDLGAMADYLTQILSDDALRAKLGSNAKEMVTKFDAAEVGKKWKYLLNTLLENKTDDTTRKELNQRLAYQVKNSVSFSGLILNELNGVVAKEIAERAENPPVVGGSGPLHVAKYSALRLARSVKHKGALETGKIVARKVRRKLR
jgi:glycosyltransferase involved in cell wall biosynthesis